MVSEQYARDVLTVAHSVYDSSRWRDAARHQRSYDPRDLELALFVPGHSLEAALTAQSVVKLSFDAAIIASIWVFEDADRFDFDNNVRLLEEHAEDVVFTDLEMGSFLARYSLNPRIESGRERLFAIFSGVGVALGFVAFLIPPATLPVLIVSAALNAPAILTAILKPDAPKFPPHPIESIDVSKLPPGTTVTITIPDPSRELGSS